VTADKVKEAGVTVAHCFAAGVADWIDLSTFRLPALWVNDDFTLRPAVTTAPTTHAEAEMGQTPQWTLQIMSAITLNPTRGATDLAVMGFRLIMMKGRGGAEWMGKGKHDT
jgi:hypothetical protein